MSVKRFLKNSASGLTYYEHNHDGDRIVTVQDVSPLLERNKARANSGDGYSADREMWEVAEIPVSVLVMWAQEWGISPAEIHRCQDFKLKMMARLDDPEWRYLRTSEGRIGRVGGMSMH